MDPWRGAEHVLGEERAARFDEGSCIDRSHNPVGPRGEDRMQELPSLKGGMGEAVVTDHEEGNAVYPDLAQTARCTGMPQLKPPFRQGDTG